MMRTLALLALSVLFAFLPPSSPFAGQQAEPTSDQAISTKSDGNKKGITADSELEKLEKENEELRKIISSLNKNIDELQSGERQLFTKYADFTDRILDYEANLLEHNEKILEWQRFASNITLLLVVLVVLAGIIFSGVQLLRIIQLGKPLSDTNLEISAGKIRVTSSIVGVVILVLSLGFLYLFLIEVYQLTPIKLDMPTIS